MSELPEVINEQALIKAINGMREGGLYDYEKSGSQTDNKSQRLNCDPGIIM